MDKEQLEAIIKINEKTIEISIEKFVNGKIRAVHKMLEGQNERFDTFEKKVDDRFDPESDRYILKNVQPIIEAYRGSKIVGEIIKWFGGIFLAYLAFRNSIKF